MRCLIVMLKKHAGAAAHLFASRSIYSSLQELSCHSTSCKVAWTSNFQLTLPMHVCCSIWGRLSLRDIQGNNINRGIASVATSFSTRSVARNPLSLFSARSMNAHLPHRGAFGAAGGGVGLWQQHVSAGVNGEVAAAAEVQVSQAGALRAYKRSLLCARAAHLVPVHCAPLPARVQCPVVQ